MLTHLRITDYALLDDVEISFGPGFNVLSGETGAGKSLLVEAVSLLRGGRISADVVRAGAEEARIEAVFEPPHGPAADALRERLLRAGIDPAEDGLVVRRVVGRTGRGRVYINNTLSTVAALGSVAGVLIELAGQHEHQTLGDPAHHLSILDAFAEAAPLSVSMRAAWERLDVARTALEGVSLDERGRAERQEFLRFQLRELDEAQLKPGEELSLASERERLRAMGKIEAVVRRGEDTLYAREGAVVDELGQLGRELGELGGVDATLAGIGKQLDEARVLIDDAARELRRYGQALEASPERLSEVEDRLDLIGRLLRKHRVQTLDALLAHQAQLGKELSQLGSHEEHRGVLEEELKSAKHAAVAAAAALSAARHKAARTLGKRVQEALAELAMGGAGLEAQLSLVAPREGDTADIVVGADDVPAIKGTPANPAPRRLGPAGWDRCEFMLSANKGEELRPLHKIASGGELSRILLAFKKVLSKADEVATYVFDEVDAGIGGGIADVVGRQIRSVAADKQVLCITHLPQIAAYADAQFRVVKSESGGRVHTEVQRLDGKSRRDEIARMLSGKLTDKARAHADEMLRSARA
jgi:DNA repair protein RecN (Recombination protein N)